MCGLPRGKRRLKTVQRMMSCWTGLIVGDHLGTQHVPGGRGGKKHEQWSSATPSSSFKSARIPNIELEVMLPFTLSTNVNVGGFSLSPPQPDSRGLIHEYSICNLTKTGSCKNLRKYEVGVSKKEFPLTLSQALLPRSQLLRHLHHHR